MAFEKARLGETDENRVKKINAVVDALNTSNSATVAEHEAAADPHPQYLTPVEGNAAYDALGAAAAAVAAHEAELDPHPQYALEAEFGQRSVTNNAVTLPKTAAADQTLNTNSDYTQVTGIFNAPPDGHNVGVTQQTNSFTINKTGYYRIEFWASTRSSANNTQLAFKFAINGTIAIGRRPSIFMRNAAEVHSGSAFGFHLFTAGDVVTLWIASDKTADITIQDAVFGATAIRYT